MILIVNERSNEVSADLAPDLNEVQSILEIHPNPSRINELTGRGGGFEMAYRKFAKLCQSSSWASIKQLYRHAAVDLGAELLEFAVVVPILLMLLIGIVWIGRAYNVYSTITRAAREGTRYAVLPSSVVAGNAPPDPLSASCTSKTDAFNNYVAPVLRADSLDPEAVINYCQKAAWLENTYPQQCGVVISFKYPVRLEIPFTTLGATTIDIPAQAQMRLENQPLKNQSAGGTCP